MSRSNHVVGEVSTYRFPDELRVDELLVCHRHRSCPRFDRRGLGAEVANRPVVEGDLRQHDLDGPHPEDELPEVVIAPVPHRAQVRAEQMVLGVGQLGIPRRQPGALEAEPLVRPRPLLLRADDRTLGADVLRPGFYRVTPNGIVTLLYGGQDEDEFGPKLLLYDLPRKKLSVLADADTAARIFREQPPDVACPPGGEGVGVKVF